MIDLYNMNDEEFEREMRRRRGNFQSLLGFILFCLIVIASILLAPKAHAANDTLLAQEITVASLSEIDEEHRFDQCFELWYTWTDEFHASDRQAASEEEKLVWNELRVKYIAECPNWAF